ncbi:unnamed protein product [Enterobius vermicularis]|uniref:Transmembrane protein n=1 Tax=Enterobius vermicularis TaxID=51028 RepID=A0A0N4VRF6_ENTVE|nr:unnamed protein product [Enterobius vermicularis]
MVKNGDLIFESCGSILKFRLFKSQSIKNVHADTSGVSLSDDFELSVQSDVPVSSVPVPDEVGDDNDVLIDDPRLLHVTECVLSAEFKVLVASIAVPDEIGDDSRGRGVVVVVSVVSVALGVAIVVTVGSSVVVLVEGSVVVVFGVIVGRVVVADVEVVVSVESIVVSVEGDKNGQKGLDTVFFFYREIGVL